MAKLNNRIRAFSTEDIWLKPDACYGCVMVYAATTATGRDILFVAGTGVHNADERFVVELDADDVAHLERLGSKLDGQRLHGAMLRFAEAAA